MLAEDERKVIDDIAEYGWHCVLVPEDKEGPGFAYSIGLYETYNASELIVFGLKRDVMHGMIWEAARQLRVGLQLADGLVLDGLIADHSCAGRPVRECWHVDYFGYAIWYYRYRGELARLSAYQIFWPGKMDGLLPWQEGCAEIVVDRQPLLYLPKSAHKPL